MVIDIVGNIVNNGDTVAFATNYYDVGVLKVGNVVGQTPSYLTVECVEVSYSYSKETLSHSIPHSKLVEYYVSNNFIKVSGHDN